MLGLPLTSPRRVISIVTFLSIPERLLRVNRSHPQPSVPTRLRTEGGAGLMETSISVALVGLIVLSSTFIFGGGVSSQFSHQLVPVVRGAAPDQDSDRLNENDSQAGPAGQPQSSAESGQSSSPGPFASEPLAFNNPSQLLGGQEMDSDDTLVSWDESQSSSSSARPGEPGYDWSMMDWSTVDWDWALAAGIISQPDPDGPNNEGSSSSSVPYNGNFDYWDVPSFIEPGSDQAYLPEPVSENDYSMVGGSLSPPLVEYHQPIFQPEEMFQEYADNSLVGGGLSPASDPAHSDYIGPLRLDAQTGSGTLSDYLEHLAQEERRMEEVLMHEEHLRQEALMHELAAANSSRSE